MAKPKKNPNAKQIIKSKVLKIPFDQVDALVVDDYGRNTVKLVLDNTKKNSPTQQSFILEVNGQPLEHVVSLNLMLSVTGNVLKVEFVV